MALRRFLALSLAALTLSSSPVLANPVPWYDHELDMENQLVARGCANPCGWAGQLCCAAGQTCYTDNYDQAQCGGYATAADNGYWKYMTRTYVETDAVTYTKVYSTYVGGAPAPVPTIACNTDNNETPCGNICCASNQYCKLVNQCAPAAAGGTTGGAGVTGFGGATPSYSAPLRPTSSTLIVVTATTATGPTVTQTFEPPVATGANITLTSGQADSGGGLSGGAIAGIVIGVLLLILLLILLCLFCFFRALWDGLMALLGLGKRRRRETTYIEEHHHSSGGGSYAAGAAGGRRWHGDRPSRIERPPKKSGFGGLGAVAAGLGGLGVALGLKRKYDKRHEKSSYTGSNSYYSDYYSDYTSSSSESSSDRHTRHTRRSSRR